MKKLILLLFTFHFVCGESLLPLIAQPVTQEWVRTYSGGTLNFGAKCMALDTNGNVYVTGGIAEPATSNDIAIVKYNNGGVQQWAVIFNSTNNGPDLVSAITSDMSGNVYITGTNYSPGGGNYALITVKYNTSGVQQWVSNYIGAYGTGEASDIAVDKQGNVYITGYTINNDPNASRYFITIKYNSSGVQQWVKTFGASGQFGSYALGGRAITLDDSANVYVTGNIQGGGQPMFTTIKYNTNGVQQWAVFESNIYGSGKKVCLDNSRNVIAAGPVMINSYPNWTTIKYNNMGIRQNTSSIPVGEHAVFNGLAVDSLEYIYIGGSGFYVASNQYAIATIKYNQSVSQQWLKTCIGVGNDIGGVFGGLVLDSSSNIYVTGTIKNSNYDYTTIKYDLNGIQKWLITYHTPVNADAFVKDIKIDKYRNIFVTGGSNSSFVTVKYVQMTGTKKISTSPPSEFALFQNYPNPFNSSTVINYNLPEESNVTLAVYDILGREIGVLVNEQLKPGTYEMSFDGTNYPSGVYFYSLFSDGRIIDTKKLVLIK